MHLCLEHAPSIVTVNEPIRSFLDHVTANRGGHMILSHALPPRHHKPLKGPGGTGAKRLQINLIWGSIEKACGVLYGEMTSTQVNIICICKAYHACKSIPKFQMHVFSQVGHRLEGIITLYYYSLVLP